MLFHAGQMLKQIKWLIVNKPRKEIRTNVTAIINRLRCKDRKYYYCAYNFWVLWIKYIGWWNASCSLMYKREIGLQAENGYSTIWVNRNKHKVIPSNKTMFVFGVLGGRKMPKKQKHIYELKFISYGISFVVKAARRKENKSLPLYHFFLSYSISLTTLLTRELLCMFVNLVYIIISEFHIISTILYTQCWNLFQRENNNKKVLNIDVTIFLLDFTAITAAFLKNSSSASP